MGIVELPEMTHRSRVSVATMAGWVSWVNLASARFLSPENAALLLQQETGMTQLEEQMPTAELPVGLFAACLRLKIRQLLVQSRPEQEFRTLVCLANGLRQIVLAVRETGPSRMTCSVDALALRHSCANAALEMQAAAKRAREPDGQPAWARSLEIGRKQSPGRLCCYCYCSPRRRCCRHARSPTRRTRWLRRQPWIAALDCDGFGPAAEVAQLQPCHWRLAATFPSCLGSRGSRNRRPLRQMRRMQAASAEGLTVGLGVAVDVRMVP